ncbi:hypothetical protein PG991_015572 [Apiospora marii]|uniref:F-box domain-containing protein n=1 Tax=Apiospora marii TaxID=335849 RepID=A0ABR1R239_9PEZI
MSTPPHKKHITGKFQPVLDLEWNTDLELAPSSAAVVSAGKMELQQAETKKPVEDLFAKLPDEIVLKIIHITDGKITILLLRQTCRQLRRLCEDATLKTKLPVLLSTEPFIASFHKYGGGSPVEAEVINIHWAYKTGSYWFYSKEAKKCKLQYRQALWRNKMCNDCAELHSDSAVYQRAVDRMYTPMRCSGCRILHPAFLFSRRERHKKADQRICIGREGHIRVCAHKTINWEDVEQIFDNYLEALRLDRYDPDYQQKIVCSECSLRGWSVNATFPWEGEGNLVRWMDICHTPEDTTKQGNTEDMSKCIGSMLGWKPSLGSCVHYGNLKSKLLPAMLQKEEEQKRRFEAENKDFPMRHPKSEVTCQMPDCNFAVQFDASGRVPIGATHGILVEYPVDPSWLVSLDPQSYVRGPDKLTRGLMWCRDPNCAVTKRGRALYNVFHQWDLPHEYVEFDPTRHDIG